MTRRVVFYIPGFDPFPPRRYRELYRKEGAEQAMLSGYELTLQAGAGGAGRGFGWRVRAQVEGAAVESRFEVLIWHDLVKAAMAEGILATYWQLLRTAWIYFSSGAILSVMRLRIGPVLAAFYPVALLLMQLLTALLLGWLVWRLAGLVLPAALAVVPAALAGYGLLWLCKRHDNRIFAHYLMHDFAYVAADRGAYPRALEERLQAFRARIRAALAEPVEEVLVVGHSSGAHMGASVLADLLREGLPPGGPVLSFLTLGHAIPMVSVLPGAARLRGDLRLMSGQDRIPWVDISAPGDGCTFALCDPAGVSGVAPVPQTGPLILSAAFSQTLSAARLATLRRRYFRLHFQYLCAFDQLPERRDAYDYFRTTAGPLTLQARYGARSPSRSRITRVVSRYRDTIG